MKKKILVVDDDRVILKFVSNLLTREGHEVQTAEDGFTALNLLTTFTPDIMFFDLIMPKIDGDKLIKIVRNMPHLADCYLVIVSAAVAEIDFNFQETGADSYIAKGPFSSMAEHFLEAIKGAETPRPADQDKPVRGLDHVYARRMTKELLSRNRHLETILESMAEGILEIYSGKIVYANAVAISLFGMTPEKILTANPSELLDENTARQLDPILAHPTAEAAEIGEKMPVELNGRQITIKVLPVRDESATIVIMITDVTERRRLEMQLQHVQKMEAIGTIAAGVAHNFRNTLSEVLVNSQLIQLNYENQGNLHEVAERINTSVRRGARLVDGLLQFSRKQIKGEFKPLDLATIIDETSQLIRKSFDQKIDIQTDVSKPLPIMGDPSSLSQALMNLCTNARDAMPDGGRLTIKAEREGKRIRLVISDSGEGMQRATIEKCFDPFFTTKAVGQGTGLGLSTTYGIIKSHEGLITVDSRPKKGTTFKMYFPLVDLENQVPREKPPEIIHGKGQRILVVDDEPDILSALKDLLKLLDYQPTLAANGKEALEQYQAVKPHAVLMDINMPEMDGLACIEKMLKIDPHANISVITGYEMDGLNGLSQQGKNAIKYYVAKPIALADLSVLLARMLEKKDKG